MTITHVFPSSIKEDGLCEITLTENEVKSLGSKLLHNYYLSQAREAFERTIKENFLEEYGFEEKELFDVESNNYALEKCVKSMLSFYYGNLELCDEWDCAAEKFLWDLKRA